MEFILCLYIVIVFIIALLTEIFSFILVSEFKKKYRKIKFVYIWTFLSLTFILLFTIFYFLL